MMSLGHQRRWYGVKKDYLLRSRPKAQGVKGHPRNSYRGQAKRAREVSSDRISLPAMRRPFSLHLSRWQWWLSLSQLFAPEHEVWFQGYPKLCGRQEPETNTEAAMLASRLLKQSLTSVCSHFGLLSL